MFSLDCEVGSRSRSGATFCIDYAPGSKERSGSKSLFVAIVSLDYDQGLHIQQLMKYVRSHFSGRI